MVLLQIVIFLGLSECKLSTDAHNGSLHNRSAGEVKHGKALHGKVICALRHSTSLRAGATALDCFTTLACLLAFSQIREVLELLTLASLPRGSQLNNCVAVPCRLNMTAPIKRVSVCCRGRSGRKAPSRRIVEFSLGGIRTGQSSTSQDEPGSPSVFPTPITPGNRGGEASGSGRQGLRSVRLASHQSSVSHQSSASNDSSPS